MPLHKLIEYTVISNEDLRRTHVKYGDNLDVPGIKNSIAESIHQYAGKAVVIDPDDRIPLWYYLILFYELYQHNPEIVLKISDDELVLLHTIYNNKDVARSSKVTHQPLLLSTPSRDCEFVQTNNINFSNTTTQEPALQSDTLIFSDENTHVADLLTFRLWFSYAEHIQYQLSQSDEDPLITIM